MQLQAPIQVTQVSDMKIIMAISLSYAISLASAIYIPISLEKRACALCAQNDNNKTNCCYFFMCCEPWLLQIGMIVFLTTDPIVMIGFWRELQMPNGW